jgi:hypothetical protein
MKPRQPDWILKPGTIDSQTGWADPDMAARAKRTNEAPPLEPSPRLAVVGRSCRPPGPSWAKRLAAKVIEARDNVRLITTAAGAILGGLAEELLPKQMRVAL